MARYLIDASRSRFTVQAFAGGLLKALGHNPVIAISDFTGTAELEVDQLDKASLQLTLWANLPKPNGAKLPHSRKLNCWPEPGLTAGRD